MPIVTKPSNLYTAKVLGTTYHEDTKSLSVLAKVVTENARVIKPVTVSFSITEEHELAQALYDRTVPEIGFEANGFSDAPIREKDIFAMNGLRKRSIAKVLGGVAVQGEVETDEKVLARNEGVAGRALEWGRNLLKKAAEAAKA